MTGKKLCRPTGGRLRYVPAETKLTLMVSVDGQLFDFVSSMTGFLKEGYSAGGRPWGRQNPDHFGRQNRNQIRSSAGPQGRGES